MLKLDSLLMAKRKLIIWAENFTDSEKMNQTLLTPVSYTTKQLSA